MKYSLRRIRLSYIAWFRYTRFYNQNMKDTNQQLSKWGMKTGQFDVISHIKPNERVTQSDLASRLVVTESNITQIIKKLEDNGLIQREREWKNKYISLTQEGTKLRNELVSEQEYFQAQQFNKLSEVELNQLINLLKKIEKK
jgi:DNA-binding MarR family transcriptional regulator